MRRILVGGVAVALVLAGSAVAYAEDEPYNQVTNGTFDSGTAPWVAYGGSSGKLKAVDGQACVDTGTGTINPWDSMLALPYLRIQNGVSYTLTFSARTTVPIPVTVVFQQNSGAYSTVLASTRTIPTTLTTYTLTGTGKGEFADGQLGFQFGGQAQTTFCIDDVSLVGGEPFPPYVPDTGPRMRVNQAGYLPDGPKGATLVTAATKAVPWQLTTAAGKVVRSGVTKPQGVDPTSGQNVQTLDFTSYRASGDGYTLTADGATSHPFPIRKDIYAALPRDSKTLFYTQRSGTPILDSVAPGYARPAGHIGVAPNQGDTAVPCLAPAAFADNWTCSAGYTRDVTGGWYDAADHGKYVVNGGIAVAQLLSEYEQGNRDPKLLDEIRWELDFLLKMQVPAGQPLAGMAYHKITDTSWTGLPLDPAKDAKPRALHRPSTAATLNLAAVAAQGARVFGSPYAERLLAASEVAYKAAKANPALYAPAADTAGGGAYADTNVADEFYWAAAELALTTKKPVYTVDLLKSPLSRTDVFDPDGFYWGSVAALGRLDLATVGRDPLAKLSVIAAAEKIIKLQKKQAYGQPYAPSTGKWAWGSNGNLLNNVVVLATAARITGFDRYRDAALSGVDFVFGRNALNISYVTGYGSVYAKNQQSRMYAHQLDPSLPNPPVGTLAGGPNSGLNDPLSALRLAGCLPQFCYMDDINSYATNELTINWNSALSWVSSFLADA
ncbi:glycoside hydrolase family 9 protein [Actinoplanes sp. LDG1-06]|uniref:Endoglucanase n=1 Tax=Paractinoplanes ovalisporus TaxID=2810368 RepID=A0ABS2AIN9_9ACTN|nr:glycoside hydrolase family 9 protein [Actinoplanes ovalisporus]MBM2619707.1 glycoside hydrolase family 9 protein [Actinoplanes ovalisporus]